METEEWEIIFRTSHQIEAALIHGLLKTSDIPVIMESSGFKTMATFFGQAAPGEYLLRVPPDQVDLVREILAARAEIEE